MLFGFFWVEFDAVGDFSVGEPSNALSCFDVPIFDESVVGTGQELLPVSVDIGLSDTLVMAVICPQKTPFTVCFP